MAIWGPKLYQNDLAEDIRNDFKDSLKRGMNAEEITQKLIKNYEQELEDVDEYSIFWLVLADTQWDYGMLLPEVKLKALECISKGTDLERWKENPKISKKREEVLLNLEKKITSPVPQQKKISLYKLYTCEWKTGDVFAYKLESNLAKEKGLLGRYLIIHKTDNGEWYPGHITPIVRIKITDNDTLPQSKEEIDELQYVQISSIKYEDRFHGFNFNGTKEEIVLIKSKLNYKMDDSSRLPIFLLQMLSTSKNVIPKKLIYIGNFHDIQQPIDEFIPHTKKNISVCKWNKFEEELIHMYFGHNFRQFSMYNKK